MNDHVVPTVIRIYADAEGESHFDEHRIGAAIARNALQSIPVHPTLMLIRQYRPPYTYAWHRTPARQFAVALEGELEGEVSDGEKKLMRTGQLVFLDDTHGKGHVTRMRGACTNLFIRVADDFDFHAWLRGPEG
jgi:hypothetical protein